MYPVSKDNQLVSQSTNVEFAETLSLEFKRDKILVKNFRLMEVILKQRLILTYSKYIESYAN